VFSAGIALQGSVPWRTLPWLLAVLVGAHAGQLVGEKLFGAELSGFLGGLIAAPLAFALERFRAAPPAFVAFLPAFWLLVPGAVGLVGVTQLVSENAAVGVNGFINALVSIVAIALGVLVAVRLMRARESVSVLGDGGRVQRGSGG